MLLRNQRSLDTLPKYRDSIIEQKEESLKASKSVLKLPKISKSFNVNNNINNTTTSQNINNTRTSYTRNTTSLFDNIDYKQNDHQQVSKLQQWTENKPTKKSRTILNTHNISYLYKNSSQSGVVRQKPKDTNQHINKFMDVQLHIARVDNQLQKIGELNYFSIYKNLEYCSGVYENSFNTLLKMIAKYRSLIQAEVDQIQLKLQMQRNQHLNKLQLLQQNSNLEYKVNEVREKLQQKEENIKPLRKLLQKIDSARIKVLKYCLSLGYDIRQQGLVWILRELNSIPKYEEFPQFLTQKEINFIITKYINQKQTLSAQTQMKSSIQGQSINQAYQYVNRRKKRQLSFIKQNQQLQKVYEDKIKDYTKDKHNYLDQSTLKIAQQMEKSKPKPTRYEVIYNQTVKKLNKITKEKIHPKNKQNQTVIEQKQIRSPSDQAKRKQKRKSTIIIQEFSKMLNLSITQSKKLDQLLTKQEKQFQEILRHLRNEKYNSKPSRRGSLTHFDQIKEQTYQVRNPISVIGCLIGWKKTQKIIEQEMFGF